MGNGKLSPLTVLAALYTQHNPAPPTTEPDPRARKARFVQVHCRQSLLRQLKSWTAGIDQRCTELDRLRATGLGGRDNFGTSHQAGILADANSDIPAVLQLETIAPPPLEAMPTCERTGLRMSVNAGQERSRGRPALHSGESAVMAMNQLPRHHELRTICSASGQLSDGLSKDADTQHSEPQKNDDSLGQHPDSDDGWDDAARDLLKREAAEVFGSDPDLNEATQSLNVRSEVTALEFDDKSFDAELHDGVDVLSDRSWSQSLDDAA